MTSTPRAAFSLAVSTFAFGYGVATLVLLPQVQPSARAELGLSLDAFGWINGATFLAAALGGVVLGRLADGGRRRVALSLAIALPACGLALASIARGGFELALARVVSGFGVGGTFGVAHTAAALLVSSARRGLAAGLVQAAAPLGAVATVFVSARLDAGADWRDVLRYAAYPGLIALAIPFFADRRLDAAPKRRARFKDVVDAARDKRLLLLFAILACHMAAYWMFYVPIPEWLEGERGLPRSFVRGYQLRLGLGFVLGDLLFAFCARRVGLKRAFVGASVLFGLGIAASPLVVSLADASPAAFTAILIATGLSAGLWSAFAPFFASILAPDRRALVSSTSYQLARASQFVLQPLVARLGSEHGGFGAVFVVAGAAAAAAGLMALAVPATVERVD